MTYLNREIVLPKVLSQMFDWVPRACVTCVTFIFHFSESQVLETLNIKNFLTLRANTHFLIQYSYVLGVPVLPACTLEGLKKKIQVLIFFLSVLLKIR